MNAAGHLTWEVNSLTKVDGRPPHCKRHQANTGGPHKGSQSACRNTEESPGKQGGARKKSGKTAKRRNKNEYETTQKKWCPRAIKDFERGGHRKNC